VVSLSFRAYSDYMLTGTIMIGTLAMLHGYLWRIGNSFFKVADLYGQFVSGSAHIENTRPIRDAYDALKKDKEAAPFSEDWKELDIKKLSFSYRAEDEVAGICGVDLHIERGKKIALIGESGSGKSTVLSLVRGLYELESGELWCDGKKQKGGLLHLRNHTTLIPQDPEIFEATIRFNITMGQDVSEEALREVVKMARLEPVLDGLPEGLDTNIKEKGVNLSGGEKQRLALARGLLTAKDNDILLLDEPTSSVDGINEVRIYRRIFSRFRDKTIVSTVHRLHLLEGFDYIYMLGDGKVVAEGNFSQLQESEEFSLLWEEYTKSLKK
jgi:ABC-type multidrug transport system fused ATPase/permease subunit